MVRCRGPDRTVLTRAGMVKLRRARRPKPAPTEEQARELALERAFRCGARYSSCRFRRRPPPRLRGFPRDRWAWELALQAAFFRGFDAATRARYAGRPAIWPIRAARRREACAVRDADGSMACPDAGLTV